MRILVTGANGFIGKNLVSILSEYHSLYVVVRKKSSFNNDIKINYIEIDLSKNDFHLKLPKNIDKVIHLAQSSKYREFPDGASDMTDVNINSTFKLLNWARISGVKHFIFSSTANVYASSGDVLTEKCRTSPSSFYGASKLAAEQLAIQYSDFFGVDILRLFTVYGPTQNNMLIPNMIKNVKEGKIIYLAGNVGINLSPIYIDDVINIINEIVSSDKKIKVRILNLCGSEKISLYKIIKIIEKKTNTPANIIKTNHSPLNLTGCPQNLLQNIKNRLFINFNDGMTKMISC